MFIIDKLKIKKYLVKTQVHKYKNATSGMLSFHCVSDSEGKKIIWSKELSKDDLPIFVWLRKDELNLSRNQGRVLPKLHCHINKIIKSRKGAFL